MSSLLFFCILYLLWKDPFKESIFKVFKIVEALFKISNKTSTDEHIPEEISECVEEIIEAVDVDRDGIITKDEFIANALKSKIIANIINTESEK